MKNNRKRLIRTAGQRLFRRECTEKVSGSRKQKALVIGDVMLDAWRFGSVERFSREAPIPLFLENGEPVFSPGGAGNAASLLASLGVDTRLCAVVGDDAEGSRLIALLNERGVGTDELTVLPEKSTMLKQRYYDDTFHERLRIDREDSPEITAEREEEILLGLRERISRYDMIIITEYRKCFLTEHFVRELISMARAHQVPVLVDPAGTDSARYRGAMLIKPNRWELGQLSGLPAGTAETAADAAAELCRKAECEYVLATLDADGMLLADKNGMLQKEKNSLRQKSGNGPGLSYRTIGAGDEVLARFAAAILAGKTVCEAVTAACSIEGMKACAEKEASFLNTKADVVPAQTSKVLDDGGLAMLEPRGRAGKRLVFTNGCFDIVHAGHVACLQEARRMGDILIVGVNSDASVSRLKGPDRPVWPLQDRMAVLAALECVDYLIPFEDDTPLRLIERLLPDVLVKGGDYQLPDIVGEDVVLSHGGIVQTVPFLEGRSSTAALARLGRDAADS